MEQKFKYFTADADPGGYAGKKHRCLFFFDLEKSIREIRGKNSSEMVQEALAVYGLGYLARHWMESDNQNILIPYAYGLDHNDEEKIGEWLYHHGVSFGRTRCHLLMSRGGPPGTIAIFRIDDLEQWTKEIELAFYLSFV